MKRIEVISFDISQVASQVWVREVDISYPLLLEVFQIQIRITDTVARLIDRELLELHDVLRKGACLVREDIVDCPKLLVEIRRLRFGSHVFFRVVHVYIVLDHCSLNKLYHLERYNQ